MAGRLITERAVASRADGIGVPVFVGRERELAVLDRALADGPTVVLIEGEAGIGKTALLREYLLASGVSERALVAGCPPFRQPHTLGPVADAIRQATNGVSRLHLSALAGTLRPLFPEWASELPAVPETAPDPTAARHRLFGALAELVDHLQVTLLAVEDAQWADEATIEFLLFLAAHQHLRISLVITYRPEDVPARSLLLRLSSRRPASATQLRLVLGPLDAAATARMVSSMLGLEHIPAGFAAFMHESTEGVPLAVEELVRLLGDRADLACRDGTWVRRHLDEIDVPPTIRDAVLERVERLAGEIRAILGAAAVLIYPADQATLITVSGLPPAQGRTGLAGALQSGLLAEDERGQLSFQHVLASRAVYEAIPAPERQLVHLRAGRALEKRAPRPVARLAGHFREAGEIRKWRRYAEQAADLAIEAGDVVTAIGLLRDLLARAQLDVRSVIRLAEKIPDPAFTGDPRFQDVVQALRSALDAGVPEPAEKAEVRFQLGRVGAGGPQPFPQARLRGPGDANAELAPRPRPGVDACALAAACRAVHSVTRADRSAAHDRGPGNRASPAGRPGGLGRSRADPGARRHPAGDVGDHPRQPQYRAHGHDVGPLRGGQQPTGQGTGARQQSPVLAV
jgi:NTP pyrophosphatase (non-canonical NTP hydrolase)